MFNKLLVFIELGAAFVTGVILSGWLLGLAMLLVYAGLICKINLAQELTTNTDHGKRREPFYNDWAR